MLFMIIKKETQLGTINIEIPINQGDFIVRGSTNYIINRFVIIDERISERDFGEFEGKATSSFDFEEFWSYRADKKYLKAENIRDFFERVYSFLDELQEKYNNMRILIVTHAGVSIPMKCYFNEIPDLDTLLPLAIENCEVYKIQNIHQIIEKQKK